MKGSLAKEFELEELGPLKVFSGIEAARSKKGDYCFEKNILLISSRKLVCWMKLISTPIEMNHRTKSDVCELVDREISETGCT